MKIHLGMVTILRSSVAVLSFIIALAFYPEARAGQAEPTGQAQHQYTAPTEPPEYEDLVKPKTEGGGFVRGARIAAPQPEGGPGEWPMARKDYALSAYSELDQINTRNVSKLKMAWSYSTGELRGHEAAPVVIGDRMYIVTPFPNRVMALDLNNHGARIWSYHPRPKRAAQGVACCDVVNRGVVYADEKIFFNTLDNRTIALDADTGEVIWETELGDINKGETMTMSPIVVNGKVLVGNSGGEFGVRGWLSALDVDDGEIAWKAYHTGPDKDVLIDQDTFEPFYKSDQGVDLGVKSWPPDFWEIGGGTAWGWISYDPKLNLIYYGTSNPGTWNPDVRPGDNKWATSLFARDPDSGEARWAYQITPHDRWDFDAVNESILVDMPFKGEMRELMVRFERSGFAYTMDRRTGEVLLAEPFIQLNWARGIDLETGRPEVNEHKVPETGRWVRAICPAYVGGKDWQPAAFSPRTGVFYVPTNNLCENIRGVETGYISGTPYVEAEVVVLRGPGGHRGEFLAWDATTGTKLWSIEEDFPVWSGALATAGDVVFYGTMDRWFRAVHARTGEILWQIKMPSGVIGQPISYLGPDGKQYIAVFSGVGGTAGFPVAQRIALEDPTAAVGMANALSDLPDATEKGGVLMVFSL